MVDLDEDFVGVGTRGTIGSLMSKELDYLRKTKHQRKTTAKLQCGSVSVFCEHTYSVKPTPPFAHTTEWRKDSGRSQRPHLLKCRSQGRAIADVSKKRVKGRKSMSDMEEGGSGSETPMLNCPHEQERGSRNSGFSIVDVVDLKCTNNVYSYSHENDKSWGISGIASRFMKRLSFSRLSV